MHCRLYKNEGPLQDNMPELYLEPVTDYEQISFEWLLKNCEVRGFGRHCDTNKILHVRIALERKEPHE